MGKYGARKTVVDNVQFDSGIEAVRYSQLKLLQEQGYISDLVLQPRFELQPAFRLKGKQIQNIEYVADFQYVEDGHTVVEDVKGQRLEVFNIKRKLFLYRYPKIDFRILTKDDI